MTAMHGPWQPRTAPYSDRAEHAARVAAWSVLDPRTRTRRLATVAEMGPRRERANAYAAHVAEHGQPLTLTERADLYWSVV